MTIKVKLSEMPSNYAEGTDELTGPQKAQIKMTYWILLGAAGLLVVSGGAYIFTENGVVEYANDIRDLCSKENLDKAADFCTKYTEDKFLSENIAAKEVFEFCKNFIPPIVTLVLGAHYVTNKNEQNT